VRIADENYRLINARIAGGFCNCADYRAKEVRIAGQYM
jgi:hypothetical protein